MKTFILFLVIGLFAGQQSFGNGNETCCPDSTSINKSASAMQIQLDLLHVESRQMTTSVPSISNKVVRQLDEQAQLSKVQAESELTDATVPQSHMQQLQLKLNSRMVKESEVVRNGK